MEDKNLEQVKELINRIADVYDLPTEEQVEEMRKLTGIDWEAEDLQMICCEYWSHNSLEETAYMMFHEKYPPVCETELVFWKQKPGAVLEDRSVYEKYRLGKGNLKALEVLSAKAMAQKLGEQFSDWVQDTKTDGESFRFVCPKQAEYWTDTHFCMFLYGRKIGNEKECQMVRFSCHNMKEEQIQTISACMADFQCSLHIREEKGMEKDLDDEL